MARTAQYDYLIVGSGLSGAVFACEAHRSGKRCLILERRGQIGGNVRDEEVDGILVHRYGPHIFHTSDPEVWAYVGRLAEMNHFINCPVANYRGEIYNLPFNMNTFSRLWGSITPAEAKSRLESERTPLDGPAKNLEQQAVSLVGREIFEKLIRGYTEKQWGRPCGELPAFIIRRIPVRYTYDNNYFNDRFQGIPCGGYTRMIERMLEGCEIRCGVDYLAAREHYRSLADQVVYTGMIDEYFGFSLGRLAYRSLRFEDERYEEANRQGVAVMNYTDRETPYTRTIEHKHFQFGQQPHTIVTREYPVEWKPGLEPYYPVNDEKNQRLYEKYAALAGREKGVLFCGRLAEYRYCDMDRAVKSALALAQRELS
ncbi:UDP-galactopyranose mutase [Faecalicatena sp. BF-R-105]|nr:UDP-galactopyranose mutase [Faecalicatena sp. BF-R-105]